MLFYILIKPFITHSIVLSWNTKSFLQVQNNIFVDNRLNRLKDLWNKSIVFLDKRI